MKSTVAKILNTVDNNRVRCEELGTGRIFLLKKGVYNVQKGDTVIVENNTIQGIVKEQVIKTFEV